MAAQTLHQLIEQTREWVDDPAGDIFDGTRTMRAIVTAYNTMVNEVESANQGWNIAPTPITITVVPTAREYVVSTESVADIAAGTVTPTEDMVRKIIEVVRVDGTYQESLIIGPRTARDSFRLHTRLQNRLLNIGINDQAVYIYRASDGLWRVGFTDIEPQSQTVEVYYVPNIERLNKDSAVPTMVPDDYHELIALRAAINLKVQENRDATGLLSLYVEELRHMREGLTRLTATLRSRPF